LATKFIEEAIKEFKDQTPTLCLLQALIISTHQMLARGVRGVAWRSTGLCVRMAYEMNLHLIDSTNARSSHDVAGSWLLDEECRRAWWAIWEMDVFASTVRRCPTAINWTQIETYLPASDEDWFAGRPQPSCVLKLNITNRWKILQSKRITSLKAWFVVVNSLMKEAQTISSPRSVYQPSSFNKSYETEGLSYDDGYINFRDTSDDQETLANALRCFVLALPEQFKYRDQYLSFEAGRDVDCVRCDTFALELPAYTI
jgi:hypothetical protein